MSILNLDFLFKLFTGNNFERSDWIEIVSISRLVWEIPRLPRLGMGQYYGKRQSRRDRPINFSWEPAVERDRSSRDPYPSRERSSSVFSQTANRLSPGGKTCTRACVLPSPFLFLPFFLILSLFLLALFSRNRGVNNTRARGIRGHEMPARKRVECRQKCRSGCWQKLRPTVSYTCANLFVFPFFFYFIMYIHTRPARVPLRDGDAIIERTSKEHPFYCCWGFNEKSEE